MTVEDAFRPDIPSTARMYDYYLGGKDNYPADREAAEKVIAMMPSGTIRTAAQQNRGFLGRVVRHLVSERNVRQFLDVGTGLPTMNNVHDVAQRIDPACRVVYVDHDPVVLAHARDMLNAVDGTTILQHDLRDPREIVNDPELRSLLDLNQPIAVLLVAILHFINDDEDPRRLIRELMEPLPSGSYLVISHATGDSYKDQFDNAIRGGYAKATSRMCNRSRDEVAALFAGLELIEPGLVWLPQWRPDPDTGLKDNPGDSLCWCGVARKPSFV